MLLIRVVEYETIPIPDRKPLAPLLMDGRWRTEKASRILDHNGSTELWSPSLSPGGHGNCTSDQRTQPALGMKKGAAQQEGEPLPLGYVPCGMELKSKRPRKDRPGIVIYQQRPLSCVNFALQIRPIAALLCGPKKQCSESNKPHTWVTCPQEGLCDDAGPFEWWAQQWHDRLVDLCWSQYCLEALRISLQ